MNTMDDNKNKIFENKVMNIQGNIIFSGNNFIQISNITQTWIGTMPKKPFQWKAILFLLIGGFFIISLPDITDSDTLDFIAVALFLGAFCVFIASIVEQIGEKYALNIELCSGRFYSFTSKNKTFLSEVYTTLINILQDNTSKDNYIINFGSGTIINESTNSTVTSNSVT